MSNVDKKAKKEKGKIEVTRSSRHGSITKAGKVRNQTPKIPKTVPHPKTNPLKANRTKFADSVNTIKEKKDKKVKSFR